MKILKEIHKKESGQALILVLILLLLGGLIIAPLMGFMGTGLIAGQVFEEKMDEVYADDAGIEDAIYNIIFDTAPNYDDLQALEDDEWSDTYNLTVNGLSVSYKVKKLSLIQGLLGEDEYKIGQPHEDWVMFDPPGPGGGTQGYDPAEERWYVEFTCNIAFYYAETGNRSLESVGVYFSPPPGNEDFIYGPTLANPGGLPAPPDPSGVITFTNLESVETKIVTGGFAFIWRWEDNQGPEFDKDNRDGAFDFTFRIYDETTWDTSTFFAWSTFKQQDISYVTNNPGLYKWLIEAEAGGTTVRAVILAEEDASTNILSWEINPPE